MQLVKMNILHDFLNIHKYFLMKIQNLLSDIFESKFCIFLFISQ